MASISIPPYTRLGLRMICYFAGIGVFAVIFLFCCFYLFSDHHHLVDWYTAMNSCFYHSSKWGIDFFTPGIKSDGNMYCVLAIFTCFAGIVYLLRKVRSRHTDLADNFIIHYSKADIVPVAACLAVVACSWAWGNYLAKPAFDEVFSAQEVAGIHPFQGLSYYMLPNNHLLFNFLNNILFSFSADQVVTGRVLSLLAYAALIVSVYFICQRQFQNRWLALLFSITLSQQFFVWGFSFQARGYELYLLAEWWLAISVLAYAFTLKKEWLYINIASIVVGYFCIPSFLYFHAAQILFFVVFQLWYRSKDRAFWQYQFAAILLTFLCYLPTLAFSGIESISGNAYVAPSRSSSFTSFFHDAAPQLAIYAAHVFSGASVLGITLFLLPLLLMTFRQNKLIFLSGLFYLCLAIMLLLITGVMRKLPFERNLIGHYSVALAGVLLLLFALTAFLFRNTRFNTLKWIVPAMACSLFIVQFVRTNTKYLADTLYEYNVNEMYQYKIEWLGNIPPGSTVAFSEEEFYLYYIWSKRGNKPDKCPSGNEEFYMKQAGEPLPQELSGRYELVNQYQGNQIYRKLPAR